MNDELSDADYELLCEALNDGFPDMLGRKNPNNRKDIGSAFSTNPLGQETTFFMPYENAPSTLTQSVQKDIHTSKDGIFDEVDFQREYLALNPFGFELEKLERYFRSKVAEHKPRLLQAYHDYLEVAEPYPLEFLVEQPGFPDVFDGIYSYGQWVENILVPYSKIWFEHTIMELFIKAEPLELLPSDGEPPVTASLALFRLEKRLEAHFLLGRMIEHYKWKFKHERLIVQRNLQFELAGSGGGKSSNSKRIIRLEAFMKHIEALSALVGLVAEERIFSQAWDNAIEAGEHMPKTAKVRFDYEVQIRSVEPFRSRYQTIFRKDA